MMRIGELALATGESVRTLRYWADAGLLDAARTESGYRAFDEDTKASGFYTDRLGAKGAPEKVVMDDLAYGVPQKARNADVYMVTKSTVTEFPNLHVGPNLTSLTKISDANPWQKEYNWVTAGSKMR